MARMDKKYYGFFAFFWYGLTLLLLFLFSYTQVDLNLTLSRISIWQTIQKTFQYVGFYNRPLATFWYIGVLISLFGVYMFLLYCVRHHFITKKHIWMLILGGAAFLAFSYPATSYDIFNHMFTAKTVLIYHQNPYLVTPLQFAGVESWLSFMRWTHVVSIYSPLWIAMTLVPYLFGFGYFLFILWNFKILISYFYLLAAWSIQHVLETEKNEDALFGVVLFACNPLVLIESLVGAHNDMVMMGLALFALAIWKKRGIVASFAVLSASIAMKLMTILLIPMYVFPKKKWMPLFLMSMGMVGFLVVTKREVMPWYFLWVMPFVALEPKKTWVTILSVGISIGLLLRYAPYFYFGHWNDPVPMIKLWVTAVPIVVSLIVAGWQKYRKSI